MMRRKRDEVLLCAAYNFNPLPLVDAGIGGSSVDGSGKRVQCSLHAGHGGNHIDVIAKLEWRSIGGVPFKSNGA